MALESLEPAATELSRLAQLPSDIVRVITVDVQSVNDALPTAVLDEVRSVVARRRDALQLREGEDHDRCGHGRDQGRHRHSRRGQ